MMNKEMSPKAIAVYEAVLSYVNEGGNLGDLTVSVIAKRAGIGKGTTYDYFSSKEEIICKSMIYGYGLLIQRICQPVMEEQGFYRKIRKLYDEINVFKHMGSIISAFEQIKPYLEMKKDELKSYIEGERDIFAQVGILIDHLIGTARAEDLLSQDADEAYASYVLVSMMQVMGGPMLCIYTDRHQMDQEIEFDFVYRMLIGSFEACRRVN